MQKEENNSHSIALIPDFDVDAKEMLDVDIPENLPILPLRRIVAFPLMMLPIPVGRESSLCLLREAYEGKSVIGMFTQRDAKSEKPDMKGLYEAGIAGRVAKILDFPDGSHTALLQCLSRIVLTGFNDEGKYAHGSVMELPEDLTTDTEFDVICASVRKKAGKLLETEKEIPREAIVSLQNMSDNVFLVNFLCSTLPFTTDDKNKMLHANSIKQRAEDLLRNINYMQAILDLKAEIQAKTQSDLSHQQREYFLHQEMKVIQEELGGPSVTQDADELREKAERKELPKQVRSILDTEIAKLQRINPQNPDYNVQLNYLQTLIELPWEHCTKDNLNLTHAERMLNKDHYGMDKVKERILEHLAVLKLRGDMRSPILCLYGPPGVGKTSLGRSIANALCRKYVRASLGGLHDEAEIRGHRRTYIGAMPGRILKGIAKAGTSNPVFVLDEIDKISGQTINGDPSSALLEVLDPEQNNAFHDNFLELDYDLSKVMFIATANDISTIPRPLLDRLELIEASGYFTLDNVEKAKRHLIPKANENIGLGDAKGIKVRKDALELIIERYTRESGVRGLEKQLNKVLRKTALRIAKGEEGDTPLTLDAGKVAELLGKEPYSRDIYQGNDIPGVVTGLAWTSVGGEILYIETSLSQGKGGKLTLTGNLGDVMKESAMLAVEFIKAHAGELGIDPRLFDQWHVHVHVPEGATPKDGPSAGVTMVTSIVSCITQRKVRDKLAMTGEITLRGKVLPVGGIKEKILAAKRAGIRDIVLCRDNRKDIEEIPGMYLGGLSFHYVDTILDVIGYALLDERAANAKEYRITEENDVQAAKD